MSIEYREDTRQFYLHTAHSTYIIELYNGQIPAHVYWGAPLREVAPYDRMYPSYYGVAYSASDLAGQGGICDSTDKLPQEYPTFGSADLRQPAFHARYADGSRITKLVYTGHRIFPGKPRLEGLPATYAKETEAESLELSLHDEKTGVEVCLQYAVFPQKDAITRSVRVTNGGSRTVELEGVLSASVDFLDHDFESIELVGSWSRERHIQRQPLQDGARSVSSARGASSHVHNPFLALVRPGTDETRGDAYGMSLVYSGNFLAGTQVEQYGTTRAFIGINPFDFGWRLEPGESFQAPEAVMVYSSHGLGELSRIYHRLYRENLCRGEYRDRERPVLVNNWEATCFNFDEEKILAIARAAQQIGLDMLVLDDGWFGKRNLDNCSLGDWVVNREKLPDGLDGLGQKLKDMGLSFGLWFEPEMVSPDSDLYRAHPDWCIHVEGCQRSQGRCQLVLDFSREDVCRYIIDAVSRVINSAPIRYVKWDMNRNMSEIGSALLPPERQRELPHRYILGLYRVLETITTAFPHVLFESCSGGGGRFDPGMLYYMPQTWCSDNTDAEDRLYIQYGTSLVYPAATMGAHVAAPNHLTKRITPFAFRGAVAMAGQFGYELDLSTLTQEEMEIARQQITFYKKHRHTIQRGDMYRLLSPFEGRDVAWQFIAPDGAEVLFFYYNLDSCTNTAWKLVKLQGLEPNAWYERAEDGRRFTGAELMQIGLPMPRSEVYFHHIAVFHRVTD